MPRIPSAESPGLYRFPRSAVASEPVPAWSCFWQVRLKSRIIVRCPSSTVANSATSWMNDSRLTPPLPGGTSPNIHSPAVIQRASSFTNLLNLKVDRSNPFPCCQLSRDCGAGGRCGVPSRVQVVGQTCDGLTFSHVVHRGHTSTAAVAMQSYHGNANGGIQTQTPEFFFLSCFRSGFTAGAGNSRAAYSPLAVVHGDVTDAGAALT